MTQYLWENILKKRSGENDVFSFLKDSFLFKDLSKKEIEFLTQLVHVRHFEAGEKIFKQGDPGVGMYLILNGTVDIIMTIIILFSKLHYHYRTTVLITRP